MGFADRSDRERALVQIGRVIDRLVREGTAVARSDGSVHTLFPVAVSAAEAEALQGWIIREGAVHTIEVGLGYAISALFVCAGLCTNDDSTARHVVIDPNQTTRFANCGLQFLEEAGVSELVEFYAEESQIVLPRFVSDRRRFDFAFVDGNHRFDGVFLDLVYLGRLLRPGGIVRLVACFPLKEPTFRALHLTADILDFVPGKISRHSLLSALFFGVGHSGLLVRLTWHIAMCHLFSMS